MDNSVNTEKIMSEIRRRTAEKNICDDIPDFESVPYQKPYETEFSDNPDKAINHMKSRSYVQAYHEISGNPIKILAEKTVRRMIKFYTEPVISEQNAFNMSAVNAVKSLRNSQKKMLKKIKRLEKENAELRKKLYGEPK